MILCEICKKDFNNFKGLGTHISRFHKITTEDYYLKYIGTKGICSECNKETKFLNLNKGYRDFCSVKCSNKSIITKKRKTETTFRNYGVENPFQSEEIKGKIRKTNLENLGVEHSSQSKLIQEKYKQTCLENLGVENPSQSKTIKEKKKQTCLKNYGVNTPLKSEEIRNKIKQTCLKKYGVEISSKSKEVKKKVKQNNFKKYGVEYPSQLLEIKEKKKQTSIKRYGLTCYLQKSEIKEKQKQICLEKFGVEYPLQSEQVRKNIQQKWIEKYGVKNPNQLVEIKNKIKQTNKINFYKRLLDSDRLKQRCIPLFDIENYIDSSNKNKYNFRCTKCNTIFKDDLYSGNIPRCPSCYPPLFKTSEVEKEISSFCKQFFPDLIENDRTVLEGKELDIFIPYIKLSIEFDGLYWHSEEQGKDKYYHLNKTLKCQDKGIKLIHIFEDEWINNKNRIKKVLLKEMGIISRETNFKDKIIVDRRFSDGKYLLENGYELVEILEPRCYYVDGIKRLRNKTKPNNKYNKIWDCGRFIFQKIHGELINV